MVHRLESHLKITSNSIPMQDCISMIIFPPLVLYNQVQNTFFKKSFTEITHLYLKLHANALLHTIAILQMHLSLFYNSKTPDNNA